MAEKPVFSAGGLRTLLRLAVRDYFPDSVRIEGSRLPSRFAQTSGPKFGSYHLYLQSAVYEAERLKEHFGCRETTRVLDVGCGMGRLPTGLLRVIGAVDYTGIDVDAFAIRWCRKHIESRHPSFRFSHLGVYNERYQTDGKPLTPHFRFLFEDASLDIIYLFSVFSHTTEEDMRIYLNDFRRILSDGGGIFFTTFVEDDVPDITFNPPGYQLRCQGPLHVVRYRKDYLLKLIQDTGFTTERFTYASEVNGQSGFYLRKTPNG